MPRALPAIRHAQALGAGGGNSDGHGPGGVHRGGASHQPTLWHTPVSGWAANRGRCFYDPRATEAGLQALRGGDLLFRGCNRGVVCLPDVLRPARGRSRPSRALYPRVCGHRECALGGGHPRGHGHAARHLFALGAHPAQGGGQDRRGEKEDFSLRAHRRGYRLDHSGNDKRQHAHHGLSPLPRGRPELRRHRLRLREAQDA